MNRVHFLETEDAGLADRLVMETKGIQGLKTNVSSQLREWEAGAFVKTESTWSMCGKRSLGFC